MIHNRHSTGPSANGRVRPLVDRVPANFAVLEGVNVLLIGPHSLG